AVNSADLIVDALLGTGVRGSVEGLLGEVIQEVNRGGRGKFVIAGDMPSGLPADTGETSGNDAEAGNSIDKIVIADYTVTFTAPKQGMFLGHSSRYIGQLLVREIGSPPELVEEVGKGNVRVLRAARVF